MIQTSGSMINIDTIQEICEKKGGVIEITFKNGTISQYEGSYKNIVETQFRSNYYMIKFAEEREVTISVDDISTIDYKKNEIKINMKSGEQINGTISEKEYLDLIFRMY